MKSFYNSILFTILTFNLYGQVDLNFTTVTFSAPMKKVTTGAAYLLAAEMDSQYRIHIVWIEDDEINPRSVMYTIYDPSDGSLNHIEVYEGVDNNKVGLPALVVDANDNPHIAFFLKRDDEADCCPEGNYAVMYASKNGNTFALSQVSTNPLNPTENGDSIFDCSVNGLPSISIDNGTVVVGYIADSKSITNYDNYYIFARKSGNSWVRSQEANVDDLDYTYSTQGGMYIPNRFGSHSQMAFIEISDYAPVLLSKSNGVWQDTRLEDYADIFDTEHITLEYGGNDNLYMMWSNDNLDKFYYTTVVGGNNIQTVNSIDMINNPSGNYAPSTVDAVNGLPVFFQNGNDPTFYVFTSENEHSTVVMPDYIGGDSGPQTISRRNNVISLVAGSDSEDSIYITMNGGIPDPNEPPINNECTSAIDLTTSTGGGDGIPIITGPYDNTNASVSDTDPSTGYECFFEPDGYGGYPSLENTVWFKFTGDGSRYDIEATTTACFLTDTGISNNDTQIAVYQGSCGVLIPVICNDDGPNTSYDNYPSLVNFQTVANTEYYIMVDEVEDACTNPDLSGGLASTVDNVICEGEILTVEISNALAPDVGEVSGYSWVRSSIDLMNNLDFLINPESNYNLNSFPITDFPETLIFDTAQFYYPNSTGTYYYTMVAVGNTAWEPGSLETYLWDVNLDPYCTFLSNSLAFNYYENEDCPNDCPSEISIDDIPIPNSLYQAQQTITSSGQVASESDVLFKAGQLIMLDNDFTVQPGGSLSIEIEDCQ